MTLSSVERNYCEKVGPFLSQHLKSEGKPLIALIQTVVSYSMPLIRDLVVNPTALVACELSEWGYRQIRECPCPELGRLGKNAIVREALDHALVEAIVKKHPERDQELVLASLGAGRTFSELRFLALLIEHGYRHFNLVVIDKRYEKEPGIPQEMQRFISEEFCLPFPELRIKTTILTSYETYLAHARPHVLRIVDLNDQQNLIDTIMGQLVNESAHHGTIVGFTRTSYKKFSIAYCSTVLQEHMMMGLDQLSVPGAFQRGIYKLKGCIRVFTPL